MKIIVDSNILISACITPSGKAANILLNPLFQFKKYCCHYLIVELFKHQSKIIESSKSEQDEVLEVLYSILKKIEFINEEQISSKIWNEADKLTAEVDKFDIAFVALTLHIKGSFLWTGDMSLIKELRRKDFESVLTTNELLGKLIKQSKEN